MANVFISHRLVDSVPAEKLAVEIKNAGHQVWFDGWEIDLGDSILGKMNEGLEGASYLVLCYSEVGVDAPFISKEWLAALSLQMSGRGIKILPVLLTGGHPPAILHDLKYADLVANWSDGLSQVLRAIK